MELVRLLNLFFKIFVLCTLCSNSISAYSANQSSRLGISYEQLQQNFKEQGIQAELPVVPNTEDSVRKLYSRAIAKLERSLHRIASLEIRDLSFNKVVVNFDRAILDFYESLNTITLVSSISRNQPLQKICDDLQKQMLGLLDKVFMRFDILEKLEFFFPMTLNKRNTPEARLLKELLSSFARKKKFLELIRDSKLSGLYTALTHKESEFNDLVGRHANDFLEFNATELLGIPKDILDLLPRSGDRYRVLVENTDVLSQIQFNAQDAKTRDKAANAWRIASNPQAVDLLREITGLRRAIAAESGYKSWAEFQTENFSIKPQNVSKELHRFLNETQAQFLALKKKMNVKTEAELEYQLNLAEQQTHTKQISEYFEYERTIQEIFSLSGALYQTEVIEIFDAPVWHPDVRIFAVRDLGSGRWLGMFCLDLYARDNKDAWPSYDELRFAYPTFKNLPNKRPVGVLNANFRKPKSGKPHLLEWSEVQIFAHELGHALDSMFRADSYYHIAYRDGLDQFTELPSTFLEVYLSQPKVLTRLARHHQSGAFWSLDDIEVMLQSTKGSKLWDFRKQAVISLLDLQLHRSRGRDIVSLEREYFEKFLFPLGKGHSFLATFDHLTGDYDSRYWTYLWAQAVSHRLAAEAVDDPANVGSRIRRALSNRGEFTSNAKVLDEIMGHRVGFCAMLSEVFR